ncbi:MAG TPA: hypothetical protein VMT52_10460 [Planctomycetota bacterium]|nr:hypothetical protein [Planctomycetota bacterium]
METDRNLSSTEREAWRIAQALNFCLSKIVGKYAAYPEVDLEVFRRIHAAVEEGLYHGKRGLKLKSFCQELRAVTSCPVSELLRSEGADDTDTRIAAVAQVVREHAGLSDAVFRELVTGILSWQPGDKSMILEAMVSIIRS